MGKVLVPEAFIDYLEKRLAISLRSPRSKDLEPVARAVAALSHRLTRKSERNEFIASTYLDDEGVRRGYLAYFTTANLPKISHPLNELALSGFLDRVDSLRILDLGAGTGAMSLGTAFWMREHRPSLQLQFSVADRSLAAVTECCRALDALFGMTAHAMETDLEGDHEMAGGPYDLILAGNLLNELSSSGQTRLKTGLRHMLHEDGFVILIEPALKGTSRGILQFRDAMLDEGWHVYAPCVTRRSCPALQNPEDWCHQSVEWQRPAFVEWIDERIGLVKRSLKYSYVVMARKDVNVAEFTFGQRDFAGQFRVVSDRFDEKGRTRLFVCNDAGRNEAVMNTRDRMDGNESFAGLERYDLVQIERFERRRNDFKIGSTTTVRRATPPEDPDSPGPE